MASGAFVPLTGSSFVAKSSSFSSSALRCGRRSAVNRRANSNATRMLVVEAKSGDDIDLILGAAKDALVVVDYSTTWCGPCKVIAPQFEKMSDKYTDVVFVKVMGDISADSGDLMKREGIRAVPAFHFWKNKERVHAFVGAKADEIEATIKEHTQ